MECIRKKKKSKEKKKEKTLCQCVENSTTDKND